MLALTHPQPARCTVRHALALRVLSGWLACSVLAACVTETSGGLRGEVSRDEALADYLQLASAYLGSGDLRNARRHLDNADKLDPNNSETAAIWGLVYSREGENALAEDNFRRSLRLDGRNSQARNNYAAFLFAQTRYQDAHSQLQQVVADTTYAQRAQAFENLGVAALYLDDAAQAKAAFERALELDATLPRASLELTSINLDQGEVTQAKQHYYNYLAQMQQQAREREARGLWQGIRLEAALGNHDNVLAYGALLEAGFSASPEYQLYRQLLDTLDDD
jgi:type IV pilus assembly protein PilF